MNILISCYVIEKLINVGWTDSFHVMIRVVVGYEPTRCESSKSRCQ